MPNTQSTGPVILNNTPLVSLWSLGRLTLLRELYHEVLIPQAVYAEFVATEGFVRQAALAEAPWITVGALSHPQQALVYVGLDQGEAEVLALALEQSARLVIIDERKARRYAQRMGLPLTGLVGVLITAKHQGLIPALRPLLEQLVQQGLFLTPELIHTALALAGEQ